MTTTATTQNCAMFHKRFSEILKTSLFKTLQNVVTFYQFRATSLQFEQSRKNLERIVHRRTKLCKLFCDCTSLKQVAQIGTELQPFTQYFTILYTLFDVVQTCTNLYNLVKTFKNIQKILYNLQNNVYNKLYNIVQYCWSCTIKLSARRPAHRRRRRRREPQRQGRRRRRR